jgi:hypothetical protein
MSHVVRSGDRGLPSCSLVGLATVLFVGCADAPPDPAPDAVTLEIRVDTVEDGRIEVVNEIPAEEGAHAVWHAREVHRFALPDPERGAPLQLEVDASGGTLVVLDRGRLAEYSVDGTEIRSADLRAGPHTVGPQVWGFHMRADGGVLVRDGGGILELDPSWAPLRRHELTPSPARLPYQAMDGPGDQLIEMTLDWSYGPGEGQRVRRYTPVRYSTSFDTADSLASFEFVTDLAPGTPVEPPHAGRFLYVMGQGQQVWSAGSREYRVFGLSLAGDTTVAFSRSHLPIEIPEAARDSLSDEWTAEYDVSDAIPDTEEAIWRIIEDDTGRVFVFPNLAGVDRGAVIDVFESGVYEGRIHLPVAIMIDHHLPVVRKNRIFGFAPNPEWGYDVVVLEWGETPR